MKYIYSIQPFIFAEWNSSIKLVYPLCNRVTLHYFLKEFIFQRNQCNHQGCQGNSNNGSTLTKGKNFAGVWEALSGTFWRGLGKRQGGLIALCDCGGGGHNWWENVTPPHSTVWGVSCSWSHDRGSLHDNYGNITPPSIPVIIFWKQQSGKTQSSNTEFVVM